MVLRQLLLRINTTKVCEIGKFLDFKGSTLEENLVLGSKGYLKAVLMQVKNACSHDS